MAGINALRNNHRYAKAPCGNKCQHIGAFHEADYHIGVRFTYGAAKGANPCHLPKSSRQRIGGRFANKTQIAHLDVWTKLMGRLGFPLQSEEGNLMSLFSPGAGQDRHYPLGAAALHRRNNQRKTHGVQWLACAVTVVDSSELTRARSVRVQALRNVNDTI